MRAKPLNSMAFVAVAAAAMPAAAQEGMLDTFPEPLDRVGSNARIGWFPSLAVSANTSSGNTDTTNIGLDFDLAYGTPQHLTSLDLGYQSENTDGTTTVSTYGAALGHMRFMGGGTYFYLHLQMRHDAFASVVDDSFAGFGLGKHVIDRPGVSWTLQAGPGYRHYETAPGEDEDGLGALIGSRLTYDFTEAVTLVNDTRLVTSLSDTAVLNVLTLNVKVSKTVSVETVLTTNYNSKDVPGREKTDNALAVALRFELPP